MFSIPRPNVILSSSGFSVEVLGRTGIIYAEGHRSIKIDSEVLAGPSGMAIYTDSINHWEEPHRLEQFNEFDRRRVIENIRAAFRFRGFDIEVM